uniref:Uncharacterized protein n=1 Tax=Chromera velia CCMP2878 TaxID=1169474 RepID=A0A0G4F9K3_9ALVE|eukprot:Cvel_174.t1-p1 / transcript=Cvel_174.t1 / gene=Cvel_174 / organism=Chromera_velia_CCMP2878 / gene_product=hypothetical protein / transcript_product=hypothetical protein / location=Cvel_scaffold11:11503-12213(-) / protein_length=237 / sequence_SO=supercontig / SO=protein_coding / is_pseudo=false
MMDTEFQFEKSQAAEPSEEENRGGKDQEKWRIFMMQWMQFALQKVDPNVPNTPGVSKIDAALAFLIVTFDKADLGILQDQFGNGGEWPQDEEERDKFFSYGGFRFFTDAVHPRWKCAIKQKAALSSEVYHAERREIFSDGKVWEIFEDAVFFATNGGEERPVEVMKNKDGKNKEGKVERGPTFRSFNLELLSLARPEGASKVVVTGSGVVKGLQFRTLSSFYQTDPFDPKKKVSQPL